jgi:hypothetical protein
MTPQNLQRHRALELASEVDAVVDQLWAAGRLSFVWHLLLEDSQRLLASLRESVGADVSELDALCRQGSLLRSPELERELTSVHRELLERLASGRRRSIAQLRYAGAPNWRQRVAALVVGASLVIVVAFALLRNAPSAQASSTYSKDFPASQAIDGLRKTEWLLPQQSPGWLELSFARPRAVSSLVLHNAVNGHYRDRAAKSVKIEAYARAALVATAEAQFPAIEHDKGPLIVDLVARDVTHVRITVESFHGNGGGLAEVAVK